MRTLKTLLAVVALIFAFVRCETEMYVCLPEQKVLFQYECLNDAWVEVHSGWLIDREGYVHAFNLPYTWNFQNSNGMISKVDLDENLLYTDSICFKVDPKILAEKVKLIGSAAEGKLSDPVNAMFDFGSVTYRCFTFDPESQNYRCILLNQLGDFVQYNKSADARALYNWLSGINAQVK